MWFRTQHSVLVLVLLVLAAPSRGQAAGQGLNLIQQENAKPGTTAWLISDPAKNHEIEGYASLTSVNRGDSISFYVNTSDAQYTVDIYRMGWYGGKGARLMASDRLPGVRQPNPVVNFQTHLVQCDWAKPFITHIPTNKSTEWVSGLYVAKLTAVPSGKQSYISFIVRDDTRTSDILYQSSVATNEAYNTWGGWSMYTQPPAYKVSFDRPDGGIGAPQIFSSTWEYSMIQFLEREGYDVSYSTDVDTHERGNTLLLHKALLVVGHDEYWSWQMRDNVENARNHKVSLGFFAADDAFWQVRYEPSTLTGALDRVLVCYRDPKLDPIYRDKSLRPFANRQ